MWSPERVSLSKQQADSKKRRLDFSDMRPMTNKQILEVEMKHQNLDEPEKSDDSSFHLKRSVKKSHSISHLQAEPTISRSQLFQTSGYTRKPSRKNTGQSMIRLVGADGTILDSPKLTSSVIDSAGKSRAKISANMVDRLAAKARQIRNNLTIRDLTNKADEVARRMENIETNFEMRQKQNEEQFERDLERMEKDKQDIFKWIKLPGSPSDNTILKRMLRIRLIEILTSVGWVLI